LFYFCSGFKDAGWGTHGFCWLDVFSIRLIEFLRSVTLFRLESQLCATVAYAVLGCAIVVCAIVVCAAGADKATD
jgi:hypothetical protein